MLEVVPVGAGVVVTVLLRLGRFVGAGQRGGVASGEEGSCGEGSDDEEGLEEAFHGCYLEGLSGKRD